MQQAGPSLLAQLIAVATDRDDVAVVQQPVEDRGGDGVRPEEKPAKHVRTHWDMLLERRSVKELEEILAERLELLRSGEIGPAHLHRANKSKSA